MTRLGFYLARLFRNDAALMQLSMPQSKLLASLRGKSIALIGNARALANGHSGDEIDAADIVIRINRAPMPSPQSHGRRTDWLALAVRLSEKDRERLDPTRILWMSPKRKRLDWKSATSPGFYLHPLTDYQRLKDAIQAPPTTGAMLIDLLLRSDLAKLTLYGFDFFASQSLSGRRTAEQVPHDFNAEAAYINQLAGGDSRLTITRQG